MPELLRLEVVRPLPRVAPNPGAGGPPGPERVEVEVETLGARVAVNGGAQGTVTEQVAVGKPVGGASFWRVWRMRLLACGPRRFRCVRGA